MARHPKGWTPPTVDEMQAQARVHWEQAILALWESGICKSPLEAHEMLLRNRAAKPRPITEYKIRRST